MLHLLLVEDEERYVKQYNDVLDDYVESHGREVKMTTCESIEEAKAKLDLSIDAAVVDLNLGTDTSEGGKVIDEIKEHFRIPVVVLTGTPDDASRDAPVISVLTKGKHGFKEVLDCIWKPYEIGLTKIMGGRGLIEQQLNKVFIGNLLPTLDTWAGYGEEDPRRTEKALLRYALGHLIAELDGDGESFLYDPPRFARTIFRSGRDRLLPYIRPFDGDLIPLALMECAPACPYQSIDLNTAHCQVSHGSGLRKVQVLTPAVCLFCHHDQLFSSNLGR